MDGWVGVYVGWWMRSVIGIELGDGVRKDRRGEAGGRDMVVGGGLMAVEEL